MSHTEKAIVNQIQINVPGIPKAQPRPRLARGIVVSTADKKVKLWREAIFRACLGAMNNGASKFVKTPIMAKIFFQFGTTIGKRIGTPHEFKPDIENLVKPVLDEAVKAGIMDDDSHVWHIDAVKTWTLEKQSGMVCIFTESHPAFFPMEISPKPEWLSV